MSHYNHHKWHVCVPLENCILCTVRGKKKTPSTFHLNVCFKEILGHSSPASWLSFHSIHYQTLPFSAGILAANSSLHMGKVLDVETKGKPRRVRMCITQMHSFSPFKVCFLELHFSAPKHKAQQWFYYSQNSSPMGTSVFVSILISRRYVPDYVTRKAREGGMDSHLYKVIQGPTLGFLPEFHCWQGLHSRSSSQGSLTLLSW